MSKRPIRFAATGARIAVGAVVAAVAVGGVVGAAAAPLPEVHREGATRTVTPVPSDAVLVCTGSFRAMGRDASQAALMVSAATMQVRTDGDTEGTTSEPLAMPDVLGGAGAQSITGKVVDRTVPRFSAAEAVLLSQEDASGLAAAPCREPALETWLVGGDTSTGVTGIILLSNPGAVTATVDLDVYGERRSATTVVVPAHTQLGIPLAAVAARSVSPVVHVRSAGAPVRAVLQTTAVRTLDPVGIDLQDGTTGPQNKQVILGVQAAAAVDGDDAKGVVVRLLAPSADAQAVLTVRAAGSGAVIDEYPVTLVASTPTEVALSGLAEGAYDVTIESDVPTLAAAKQITHVGDREDFAWSLPAPELGTEAKTQFSVPAGAPATLYVHNADDEEVTIELGGADARTVRVKPDGSTSIQVRPGGYQLSANGRIQAAVGLRGGADSAALAGWPLWASAATQQPIVVRP